MKMKIYKLTKIFGPKSPFRPLFCVSSMRVRLDLHQLQHSKLEILKVYYIKVVKIIN